MTSAPDPVEVTEDESDDDVGPEDYAAFAEAVVFSTDWTTETIVQQLERENILLNPRFQRRDAWSRTRKSLFVESLILGLPIPQIVLAETREQRGKYIVLDGKQRLLALLQFWGLGKGANNAYSLIGLVVRSDLRGKQIGDFKRDPALRGDLTTLQNATMRTVVIRNWPNRNFLHQVFLRLNTGSVKLSPQELRQALNPGPFTDFVDDAAIESAELKAMLGLVEPDSRMRDVELLARALAFANFIHDYPGRMKKFLDTSFDKMNTSWESREGAVRKQVAEFNEGITALVSIFGVENIARKPGSRAFNKAIFDTLIFYFRDATIRGAALANPDGVREAYRALVKSPDFVLAADRDTAGTPNTATRFREWGTALRSALGMDFAVPERKDSTIVFAGF